jgi:hypothetical protein
MDDLDKLEELANDIRALCSGHPHAKIAWPHRELHDLADRAQALARRDGVSGEACAAVSDLTRAAWAMIEHFERVDGDARHKAVIARLTAALTAHPAPTAHGDEKPLTKAQRSQLFNILRFGSAEVSGSWSVFDALAARGLIQISEYRIGFYRARPTEKALAAYASEIGINALRQPDTAGDPDEPLTADRTAPWVPATEEEREHVQRTTAPAPSTAEDACMAGGELARQIDILRRASEIPLPDDDRDFDIEKARRGAASWRTMARNTVAAYEALRTTPSPSHCPG